VTLYHGRCEDILPRIPAGSVDALVTDPPYFQVKDEDWDNQWAKVDEFIAWLAGVTDQVKPALKAHASVWMFASPALTSTVERMLAERFRILASIRWVKTDDGFHQRASRDALRTFLTAWEGILFAEQFVDAYGDMEFELHKKVFAPIGQYIQGERERAGMSRREIAARLTGYKNEDSANANIFNWELGKNLIGKCDYLSMRVALGRGYLQREYEDLQREYEDLRREYEDLRREYEDLRRPFTLPKRGPKTDVWDFKYVHHYPGKHPTEKPQGLLRHIIETTTRPGAVILDPFAGSGSTLLAARDLGRQAIGIEQDQRWCEHAARKLNQTVLNFDEAVTA
jgi:site-specific DNA-methyltransferase (adenine-specific)